MYGISYAWHGMFLNDFSRITVDKQFFFLVTAVVYFVIAFAISFITYFVQFLKNNPVLRGLMVGAPVGLLIYLIAFVFGISFYTNPSLTHIAFDCSWQIVEQALGGVVVGFVYSVAQVFSTNKSF